MHTYFKYIIVLICYCKLLKLMNNLTELKILQCIWCFAVFCLENTSITCNAVANKLICLMIWHKIFPRFCKYLIHCTVSNKYPPPLFVYSLFTLCLFSFCPDLSLWQPRCFLWRCCTHAGTCLRSSGEVPSSSVCSALLLPCWTRPAVTLWAQLPVTPLSPPSLCQGDERAENRNMTAATVLFLTMAK